MCLSYKYIRAHIFFSYRLHCLFIAVAAYLALGRPYRSVGICLTFRLSVVSFITFALPSSLKSSYFSVNAFNVRSKYLFRLHCVLLSCSYLLEVFSKMSLHIFICCFCFMLHLLLVHIKHISSVCTHLRFANKRLWKRTSMHFYARSLACPRHQSVCVCMCVWVCAWLGPAMSYSIWFSAIF